MYQDTITLFNRHKSRLGDTWYPTVLTSVNINTDRAAIVAKYGAESKDNAILNVRFKTVDGKKMLGDKEYLPPKEWLRQTSHSGKVTFECGQSFDFFCIGDWGNEDVVYDSDYTDGFYHYMNSKYDQVYAITSASLYTVIPHFEIAGK